MNKLLLCGLMAAALSFMACDEFEEAVKEIKDDQAPAYVESNGGLNIQVSQKKSGFGSIHEASFKVENHDSRVDTVCQSAQTKLTFFTEILADAFLESLESDSALVAKWDISKDKNNAKAITINQTNSMAGLSKFVVAPIYKGIKKAYDDGGEILEIMKKFNELNQ